MDKLTTLTTATQIATTGADSARELALGAELVYDATDPWAVTMVLQTPAGEVVWTFARELLLDGQYEPVGDGDVHIWPCLSAGGEAVVIVELDTPHAESMLQFRTRAVHDFVQASVEAVPVGTESADVDEWIDQLLGD